MLKAGAHLAFVFTPDQVRGDETGNDPFQIQTASPPETPSAGCEADGCLDFARHERVERNEETNGVEGNSDTNGLRGWGHAAPPCPSHARLYKRRHHGRSRQQPAADRKSTRLNSSH